MKRYMILITAIYMLGLVIRCTPIPPSERSAVQVTPSRVPANTMTLSESLTREAELDHVPYNPEGRATVRSRLATVRAERTPGPTAIPHYGILEHGDDVSLQSSFAPGAMQVTNAWRGLVDGEVLLVYAGTRDPEYKHWRSSTLINVGRLVVYRKGHSYTTTEETGALIIVGECHGRLLLTTAGSDSLPPQEMTYDLRAYEMSNGHPTDCVPTVTGTPTPHDE